MLSFSRVVVLYIHFVPGNTISLALAGRYSAHAMASHAQDCPDRKLERPIFLWRGNLSPFLFQESISLTLVRCYSAHATALHTEDCPDWRLEKNKPPFIPHSNHKNVTILVNYKGSKRIS